MKRVESLILLTFTLFLLASVCQAQESEDELKLETITVKGEAIPYSSMPATINIIGSDQIEDLMIQRTDEILEQVPGIEIGNYNQGGVANSFSIRGFRSAAHGGDAAIYIDGIPLNEGESHADGYADMNVIIPLEIDRVEVYKGPCSALFGNFARGGTISFHTKKTGTYNKLRAEYVSFDTIDIQGAFGHKFGSSLQNNTAFQFYSTDGYQDNSRWLRGNFATRFGYRFTEKLDASVSLRFHRSEWDAPGYIPEDQFKDDDEIRHQAPNAEDDGGEKEFYTQRLDLGYNLTKDVKLLYWFYLTQQDFTRFAKFGYNPGGQTERNYNRHVYGTGASVNFQTQLYSLPLKGVLGAEYYYEDTDWLRWNTSNRVRIEKTQDREFTIETASLFGQIDMEISRYFRPQAGLRFDSFDGNYKNHDPGTTGFHHDMNEFDCLSPKIGFRSLILDSLDFRVSYSEGFALPKGEAKYDPEINVDPVNIRQYEIGFTFTPLDRLWIDLAAYILDTENEIQEDPPGSGDYENIGKTRRKGVELGFNFSPFNGLDLFGNLSFIDTEIKDNPDKDLEGNEVRGIPENIINLGVKYVTSQGVGTRIRWRHVGQYYIDSDNLYEYDGYDIVDLALFYDITSEDGKK